MFALDGDRSYVFWIFLADFCEMDLKGGGMTDSPCEDDSIHKSILSNDTVNLEVNVYDIALYSTTISRSSIIITITWCGSFFGCITLVLREKYKK